MIVKRTLQQWNTFIRHEWQWFGNVVMGENADPIYSYNRIPRFGLNVMIESVKGVQQVRSQHLSKVFRLQITPTEEEETNIRTNKSIQQTNLETKSFLQLEEKCLETMKAMKRPKR